MQKLIMSSKCSHGSSRLSSVTSRQCVKGPNQSSHVYLFVCFQFSLWISFFQMSFYSCNVFLVVWFLVTTRIACFHVFVCILRPFVMVLFAFVFLYYGHGVFCLVT